MSTYYANLSIETTGGSGSTESPFGWTDLDQWLHVTGPAAGDVVALRGGRDNGGSGVTFSPANAVSFVAWDAPHNGPWWLRSTADVDIITLSSLSGGCIWCRDMQTQADFKTMHVTASNRILLAGSADWLGSTVYAAAVDYSSGTIALTAADSVLQTTAQGTVPADGTASILASSTIFRCANSKAAWFDAGSGGYASATWSPDSTCDFGRIVPAVEWSADILRADLLLPWAVRDSVVAPSGSYSGYATGLWGGPRDHVGAYVFAHPRHYSALKQSLPILA
jgi:hypothetical protein